MNFPSFLDWHEDGHRISLVLEADKLLVLPERCPNGGHADTGCYHPVLDGCLVNHFVKMYGLDLNLSTAVPKESMQIVWAWSGNVTDVDSDTCYFMFTDDDRVSGWIAAEKEETANGGTDD